MMRPYLRIKFEQEDIYFIKKNRWRPKTDAHDNDTESSIPFYSQSLEIVIILPFLFITSKIQIQSCQISLITTV
jgi:hypothetical protein